MEAKNPSNSGIVNKARNLAINLRGSAKTRGGKVPAISVRDLTSTKKVFAPNIPQRRRVIKTEVETSEQGVVVKTEKANSSENVRGKERGRHQKVYLQTEGSFLAEGPAARSKRDRACDDSFSISRASRKSGIASCDKNIEVDVIKDLMESFVVGEEYEDRNEGKPPVRLPLPKDRIQTKKQLKLESNIKLESEKDDKIKIKKEIIEDFETGIKREIKTEKDEDYDVGDNIKEEIKSDALLPNTFLKVKEEINEDFSPAEDSVKEEHKSEIFSAKNFLNVKEDGILVLLQLPVLSNSLRGDNRETDKEAKEKSTKEKEKQPVKENEPKEPVKFINNFEEGFIGKLKIMKSGRKKLTLGSVEFELLDGTPSETYQEAASIQMRGKEGDITVLGKIENKLILSPVINKLLTENVKNSKTLDFEQE